MSRRCFARLLLVRCLLAVGCVLCWGQSAEGRAESGVSRGLRNAVVLIIRHAEKPENGNDLTDAGINRARAYADFFKHFTMDSQPVRLDCLFAAADSKLSHRPRLTLEPLSAALGFPLETRFKAKQAVELAEELKSTPHGKGILICWHHGQIPALIGALGGQPDKLLPNAKWPSGVFNWVIELRYDEEGRIIPGQSKCINENLMPGDSANPESGQRFDGSPGGSPSQVSGEAANPR